MIPPVRTDPVWGRAQYGSVQLLGGTGLSPRLVVRDWTGLIWTSPHMLSISTLFLSQVPLNTWLILTFNTAHLWILTLGEIVTVLSVYLVPSRHISPIKRPIQWKNTLNLDTVLDWSKSVQASSVQVQKSGDWSDPSPKITLTWLAFCGPGLDWSNAGLVESLCTPSTLYTQYFIHPLLYPPSTLYTLYFIHLPLYICGIIGTIYCTDCILHYKPLCCIVCTICLRCIKFILCINIYTALCIFNWGWRITYTFCMPILYHRFEIRLTVCRF